jgi:hypothetical protein
MNAHVQRWIKTQGQSMSLLQKTDVYQGSEEKAARKQSDYGFILVLVCVALALAFASVVFTPALVGGVPPVGPYVGP